MVSQLSHKVCIKDEKKFVGTWYIYKPIYHLRLAIVTPLHLVLNVDHSFTIIHERRSSENITALIEIATLPLFCYIECHNFLCMHIGIGIYAFISIADESISNTLHQIIFVVCFRM